MFRSQRRGNPTRQHVQHAPPPNVALARASRRRKSGATTWKLRQPSRLAHQRGTPPTAPLPAQLIFIVYETLRLTGVVVAEYFIIYERAAGVTDTRRQKTRAAICKAFAEVLAESETGEFSMQEVANRANVTHRTVYNHFPSREALMDGLVEYQEERALMVSGEDHPPSPESGMFSVEGFPSTVATVYRGLARDEAANRAFAMLSVSARRPASRTIERTARLASALGEELNLADPDARRLAAAVRLFGTQVGWHLLTQHYDLPNHEAAATAKWAVRVLLQAAAEGDLPKLGDSNDDD